METANDFIKSESKKRVSNKCNSIYEYINVKQNDKWMQDWMEQTSAYKIGYENSCSFDNDDFCYYVDVT